MVLGYKRGGSFSIEEIISSSFILSLYTILSDKFWRKGKLSSKEKKGFLSKKSAR
jgi:hypothetical protein